MSGSPSASAGASTPAGSSNGVDNLTCQWGDCRQRCTSAELLYEHVCEKHVGRKSTNNLNLTCQWGNCRTTTVKRDHITSHIRVHVPLKPHKCEFCGKCFKRPQDLKKHVKTHADESVLLNSPQPAGHNRTQNTNGYQSRAAAQHPGYLDNAYSAAGGYTHYQPHGGYGHYSTGIPAHPGAYGPVYYGVAQTSLAGGDAAGFDSRRRGHDGLNDFFGDIKRKHIDPGQYYDVHQRLQAVQGLDVPFFGNMSGMEMGDGGTAVASYGAPLPGQYPREFSELKTKNDLMSIDQFLQQLQGTVYEDPEHKHAFANPGSGMQAVSQGDLGPLNTAVASANTPSALSTSSFGGADSTPALTPNSYSSMAHSPGSAHSHSVHNSVSPVPRPANVNLYPSLPALSSLNDMQGQYPPSTGAPPSGLGNSYDDLDGRRRYSGGFLQRAQPKLSPPAGARRESAERDALAKGVTKMELSAPRPAEVGEFERRSSTRSRGSSSGDDKEAAWVQNMRVIEKLREYIQERLQKQEYDEGPARPRVQAGRDVDGDREMRDARGTPPSLYPVLRPISS